MRPLDFLGWWLLRYFGGRGGFGKGRAVCSGGVGQLYAQGGEGQGLATCVVRHGEDEDEDDDVWERGKRRKVFGNEVAGVVM